MGKYHQPGGGNFELVQYTLEEYDAETGLYYLRARYYDPRMGRSINEDTVEGQIDNPLSLNLYTYGQNNPLTFIDPSGHKVEFSQNQYDYLKSLQYSSNAGLKKWATQQLEDRMAFYDTNSKKIVSGSFDSVSEDYATEAISVAAIATAIYTVGAFIGAVATKEAKDIIKGTGNSFIRGTTDTTELNANQFNGLKNNGVIKVNSSGSNRPVTGTSNSYYTTANGEHVFVYDGQGKLIYDLSADRVKAFKINANPTTGQEFYQPYKLDGAVPQFIKNLFGW